MPKAQKDPKIGNKLKTHPYDDGDSTERVPKTGDPFRIKNTGKRVPKPANPFLNKKGVNTMLVNEGAEQLTMRTDAARAAHDDKWRAIWDRAKLTEDEVFDVTSKFETCDSEEIAGLSELLGDMRVAQGFSGGGKMVGGNPILHFARLQKWLIDHSGVAAGIDSMSACAKWFIDKILAGLSTIGRGLSRASSGCMNLARRAMTEGTAAGNKAFTLLLGFAEAFQTMSSSAGTTVKTKFSHWVGTAGTAASGWSADASAAANPYLQELKGYLNTNLDALQTKILARLPNPPSAPEFRQWLDTLSMNDVLLATANVVAVYSILPDAGRVASSVMKLLAMAFSNGIVGAAWIADNKMLTGSLIVYQGVLVMSPEIIPACKKVDEYLANTIGSTTEQDFLVQIRHLKSEPIAKALARQVIHNKITTNTIARDEAQDRLTRAKQDKALQDHAQELEDEAAALNNEEAALKAAARGLQDDAAEELQEHAMGGPVVAEVVAAVVEGAGGGAGGGATMDQSGSASDDDELGGGGKRATRKRGKRSSKRGSRKTKTTRKKTTRKKRRGKK